MPAPTQNHFVGVFVYFVYLCFHKWTQDGHLLPSLAKDESQSVPIADRDGGAGTVVDIQVDGGKQLLPLTDPFPPKPHGDLPASKALVSHPLSSAGTD